MEGLFSSGIGIVIYFAFLFGIMWLILIRPQRKRDKAMQELQDSIKVGDMVLTHSGMYGKVVDIVNDLFVLEFGLNRGIRIPVEKKAIMSIKEPNLSIVKEDVQVEEVVEKEEKVKK